MWAFLIAGILVSSLASLTGWVGMRSRLSTYMILKFSFGEIGARIVNLSFAFAQIGWFGVNAYFFGASAEQLGRDVVGVSMPSSVYVVLGGALMTFATVFGFKALDRLALFVVPVMLSLIVLMLVKTFDLSTLGALSAIPATGDMTFSQAITVLAGGIIVGVLLVPDLTRYARGPKDVFIAVGLALLVIEVFVHVVAAGPALMFNTDDPITLMLNLGLGAFALIFLIVASLSTNMVNLYGSGLAMAATFPRTSEWKFVLGAGTIGTALAMLNVADFFVDFLVWQGTLFTSVLGVYVADFFLIKKGRYDIDHLENLPKLSWGALIAWVIGAAVAVTTYKEVFQVTGASSLDGAIVSAVVYIAIASLPQRKKTSS